MRKQDTIAIPFIATIRSLIFDAVAVGPMIKSRLYPGGDPRAPERMREKEREDLTSSCETRCCKSLDFTGNSRRNDVSFLKGISTGTNGYAAHGRLLNFKRSSFLFREGGDASLHQSRLRPSS